MLRKAKLSPEIPDIIEAGRSRVDEIMSMRLPDEIGIIMPSNAKQTIRATLMVSKDL